MSHGYELWFAREALKRNPDLVLYALPWTFPEWVETPSALGGGKRTGSSSSRSTVAAAGRGRVGMPPDTLNAANAIEYLADFVDGLERALGRPLQYLGWHNESPWADDWVLGLRRELDRRDKQHVQLVVGDCGP